MLCCLLQLFSVFKLLWLRTVAHARYGTVRYATLRYVQYVRYVQHVQYVQIVRYEQYVEYVQSMYCRSTACTVCTDREVCAYVSMYLVPDTYYQIY